MKELRRARAADDERGRIGDQAGLPRSVVLTWCGDIAGEPAYSTDPLPVMCRPPDEGRHTARWVERLLSQSSGTDTGSAANASVARANL